MKIIGYPLSYLQLFTVQAGSVHIFCVILSFSEK